MFNKYFIFFASLLFALYIASMVAYPFYISGLDWNYVQGVWNTWQTLNAAMIALLASIIALATTMYSEHQKRERELLAAKALLPEALTQLIYFCKHSAGLLKEAYINRNEPNSDRHLLYINGNFYQIPEWVDSAFQGCIVAANKPDAIYMTDILAELQIIRARLVDIHYDSNREQELLVMPDDIIAHIRKLGYFAARVTALFPYARDGKPILREEANNEMINKGLSQIDAIEAAYTIE
ncbi:hypothetical protein [Aeromonas veronii]|uniref:hypothetical protein n=1 Tax=Aeromonas veronii TaxID=654 RepID=UPI00058A472F|nr:hypothetical protein [Aeromonas veronii]